MTIHVTLEVDQSRASGSTYKSKGQTCISVFSCMQLDPAIKPAESAVYNPLYYEQAKVSGGQAFGHSLGSTAGRRSFHA